jgi:hypothetical protein
VHHNGRGVFRNTWPHVAVVALLGVFLGIASFGANAAETCGLSEQKHGKLNARRIPKDRYLQLVNDVLARSAPDLSLAAVNLAPEHPATIRLGYTGPGSEVVATCSNGASMLVPFRGNISSTVEVGVCKISKQLRPRDVCQAASVSDMLLTRVMEDMDQPPAKEEIARMLSYETTDEDLTIKYIPVTQIGHGVAIIPTVVLQKDKGDSFVLVQADMHNICTGNHNELCAKPNQSLLEIAKSIANEAYVVAK